MKLYFLPLLLLFLAPQGIHADILERSRTLLAQDARLEPQPTPRSFMIQELRSNGAVRETLQVLTPEQEGEEPIFLLNGNRINPETDSLGRFDNFADNFPTANSGGNEDDDVDGVSGASSDPQAGLPRFETLRTRRDRGTELINGRQTRVLEVEFNTWGGDVNRGKLWVLPVTGEPVQFQYDAKTPFLVSATTTSQFNPGLNGTIERRSMEIMFRIGVLMLSRTYRMFIEY